MVRKVLLAGGVALSAAGSIELVSSDITTGGRVLDNIKGKWSQTLKFLGKEATLEANYDRNANENFLESASISGKLDDVSYDVKTGFDGGAEVTLSTDTKDGTSVEVVANTNSGVTKVAASRGARMFDRDVDVEASHQVQAANSKLSLSTVLGYGVKATANVGFDKSGSRSNDYELEYESSLGDGRSLSANVNPSNGNGEIEYVDSATIDATITASLETGGKPKVTVKRSWGF